MVCRCRGFTLLELLIVIVVIAVLLGMVSLSFGPNPATHARQVAQEVTSTIEHLREQAVVEGREYGLRLSQEGYRGLRLAEHGWQPVTAMRQWPPDLGPRLELDGYFLPLGSDAGAPQILMLSSDETSVFTLTFASEDKVWLRLSSTGIGRVLIDD
jgi:general secretion pathway protein H